MLKEHSSEATAHPKYLNKESKENDWGPDGTVNASDSLQGILADLAIAPNLERSVNETGKDHVVNGQLDHPVPVLSDEAVGIDHSLLIVGGLDPFLGGVDVLSAVNINTEIVVLGNRFCSV